VVDHRNLDPGPCVVGVGDNLDLDVTSAVLESVQTRLHHRQLDLRQGITRERDALPGLLHGSAGEQLGASHTGERGEPGRA